MSIRTEATIDDLYRVPENGKADPFAELLKALTRIKGGKMSTYEEIISAGLSLPSSARAIDQKRIDSLWAEEAERRVKEIEDGVVTTIPGEEVMNRLRARNKQ